LLLRKRILLLVLILLLLIWIRLLTLHLLAKNRNELPLVILLTCVIDLNGFLPAVGRDSDDSARTCLPTPYWNGNIETSAESSALRAALPLLALLRLLEASRARRIRSKALLLLSGRLKAALLALLSLHLLLHLLRRL
jgi:hypothetical protein